MLTLLIALNAMKSPDLFLATYFVDNGQTGAMLAISEDGLKFRPMVEPNRTVISPEAGPENILRDPCILKGAGNTWHMVWTTGWWDTHIGIAHSTDAVHWSKTDYLPVMTSFKGVSNTWAPEIVYDKPNKQYVIYWASTIEGAFPETARKDGDLDNLKRPLNNRLYATTTRDFKTYTPTKLLWDPGFNCIDATMIRARGKWLLFGKDETKAPKPAKHIFMAEAESATGPFKIVAPKITGSYWAEGPTAVDLGDRVRVYFDRYTEGKWGAVESTDLKNWTDVSDKIAMVPGARHGTILKLKASLVEGIQKLLQQK